MVVQNPASPSFDNFKELSESYNYIPIFIKINKGKFSPVSVYKNLNNKSNSFLLESVEGNKEFARYSFIGINPKEIIKTGKNENIANADPLIILEKSISNIKRAEIIDLPQFSGGAVGFLSYEAVSYFEPSVKKIKDSLAYFPESIFLIGSSLIIFDHEEESIFVVSNADLRDGANFEKQYNDCLTEIEHIISQITESNIEDEKNKPEKNNLKIEHITPKEKFMESVEDTKKLIYEGEMIQAVLSQKLKVKTESSAIDIFNSLRNINPSPYMFLLDFENFQIIGSSPELLVKLDNNKIAVHPIAGTRPRGKTDEEDRNNEKDLLSDEKEISEHLMLLDLGRNDLGKIAKPGTVNVTQQMEIERYSHVMHIVSHVEAELSDNYNAFDVLRSAFPAGTVSGAPKVRAMKQISEREPFQRGPYSGAVGYFSFDGSMDTAIAIRTIVLKENTAIIQAGAGIVADSDPETEHNECLAKMGALIKALEYAERSKNP
ncbi:MAG: anthranilate synthase component I [Dehalococcoidia bacterium]|nr:anthranilate synthase component I [Dehalococcoidia bacterium]|tara:strand:+ start:517 stop:1986 length:1470 start_codon:yes stop_codon:yes gene_type:complete